MVENIMVLAAGFHHITEFQDAKVVGSALQGCANSLGDFGNRLLLFCQEPQDQDSLRVPHNPTMRCLALC